MLQGGKPEQLFSQCLKETIADAHHILDIGTSQRFAKELRPYEHWFKGKEYIAAGYMPQMGYGKYNCDCHQDIHEMSFEDSYFDAVLCIEVLEHVTNPFKAISEIKRVLRSGGKLLLTTPFLAQYHGKKKTGYSPAHESYPDFWRFTHQGLELLFDDFQSVKVFPLDGPIEFRLKQFYLTKYLGIPFVRKMVDWIDRPRLGKATTRQMVFGTK